MRVFSIAGAQHYCQHFQHGAAPQNRTLDDFVRRRGARLRTFTEGSLDFEEYRTLALRNVERDVFLAASHLRRSLDLMVHSAGHWAHVTLYYGAFYAARALLGMFGCRVFGDSIVEVERSQAGAQRLVKRAINRGANPYTLNRRGSHERFWEAFYNAARSIRPLTHPSLTTFLTPIFNDAAWLIKQRNMINYLAEDSLDTCATFLSIFDDKDVPNSLPGTTNTQYQVSQGLLTVALDFSDRLALVTDALDVYGVQGSLQEKVKRFVYEISVPTLVAQTDGHRLFGILLRPPLMSNYLSD